MFQVLQSAHYSTDLNFNSNCQINVFLRFNQHAYKNKNKIAIPLIVSILIIIMVFDLLKICHLYIYHEYRGLRWSILILPPIIINQIAAEGKNLPEHY